MPLLSPLVTFADSRDGDFSVTQTLEGEGGGNVCILMNLFLRNCTFSCKKNKKDYLNICHIKKKSLSNTCDIPTIEFIVFMWKQCFRGIKQNSSELPVSSFDLEEFCFALFSFFHLFAPAGEARRPTRP